MQDTYKQTAVKAAKEAGKIQLRYFGNISKILYKDETNAVTNADLESEKAIIGIIKKKFPNHNIISEEAGRINGNSQYTWLIDPLDGTHNYMHNLPLFGVSIGLEFKKEIILGVIYLPFFNDLYVAEKGKNAFLNNKKIKVSKINNLRSSMVFIDGGIHKEKKKKLRILNNLAKKAHKLRVVGAAVIDFVYVAEGRIESSILTPTKPWDIAAGILIVKEAGGKVTDFKGKSAGSSTNDLVISNGKVHQKILDVLK